MSFRIASPFLMGLVVAALASLACSAEAPAPTATPTPQVSAQEVVESACAEMENVDNYDMTATIKIEVDGVPDEEFFSLAAVVSGEDYAAKWTASSDGATGELVRVAGQGYIRESIDGRGWEIFPGELPHINSHLSDFGVTLTCPSLDKVALEGEETDSGGSAIKRYSSGEGEAGLAEAPKNVHGHRESSAHTFWVDANGLLVQHRQVRHELVPFPDGRFAHQVTNTLTTFSGIGEANTITAPAVGE